MNRREEDDSEPAQRRARDRTSDLLEELRQRDQLWRNKYHEMLGSLDGSMVEQVVLKAGLMEYFEKMKERDRLNVETIQQLTSELHSKSRQLERLQSKLDESEEQCIKHYRALTEIQVQKDQWEAEKKAKEEQEQERLLQVSRSMNNLSSYASSIIGDCDIPPPPPISMEEILDMTAPNNLLELPSLRGSFYGGAEYSAPKLSGAGSIGGISQKSKLSRSGSMRYQTTTTSTSHQLGHTRSTNQNSSMRQY